MLTMWNALDDVMPTEPWFTSKSFEVAGLPVRPAVDVAEQDAAYLITAELPGVELEDVRLELEDDVLKLSAEKRREAEHERHGFRHVERRFGSFVRTFELPDGIDRQAVKAELKDGVLTIMLPKSEAKRPRRIPVQIAGPKPSAAPRISAEGTPAESHGGS